jgi:hypothetical protein
MIISLFMDETPLRSGSGNTPGARPAGRQGGRQTGALPNRRGDDRDDHEEHAEDVHVSASPRKSQRPAGLSW